MSKRFDGYLPIVIDVETGGSNDRTDALLELAAILIDIDDEGNFIMSDTFHRHVNPFKGANLDPDSMKIHGIDPYHPFRFAQDESEMLPELFKFTRDALKKFDCRRAILVGHNAHFDLGFLQAAANRCKLKNKNPYHSYTVFDTATLGGLIYKKTVLAKIMKVAKVSFDVNEAHSALYDTQKTAELFCKILNDANK